MTSATREALWERLRSSGLVEGEPPAPQGERAPWFLRVMLGIAGWIGALFLLGFLGAALPWLVRGAASAIVAGAAACVGAALLFGSSAGASGKSAGSSPRGDFLSQFAFAISLTGQALLAMGLSHLMEHRSFAALAFLLALQQAVLFLFVPSFAHRVWCAWTGTAAAVYGLGQLGLGPLAPALLAAAFATLGQRVYEGRIELRSAALHGLAISLITALSVYGGGLAWSTLFRDASGPLGWPEWVGSALSGAVLLWLVAVLLRAHGVRLGSLQARAALAVAAVLALATLKAPGLAPAIVILLTGFANGNRLLVGAGIVALVLYLSSYYYLLEVTLLTKSVVLFFTGIALLGARMLLNRAWPDREVQRA